MSMSQSPLSTPPLLSAPSSPQATIPSLAFSHQSSDDSQQDTLPVVDQCIFMRYYKMKRRGRIFPPRPIQAAAGPDELPPPGPGSDTLGGIHVHEGPHSSNESEFEPVPGLERVSISSALLPFCEGNCGVRLSPSSHTIQLMNCWITYWNILVLVLQSGPMKTFSHCLRCVS